MSRIDKSTETGADLQSQGIRGFLLGWWKGSDDGYILCACVRQSLQSHLTVITLCDPMDSSPSGSSVHGIHQARILEWAAISLSWSGDLPDPGIKPESHVSSAWQVDSLLLSHLGSPAYREYTVNVYISVCICLSIYVLHLRVLFRDSSVFLRCVVIVWKFDLNNSNRSFVLYKICIHCLVKIV